MSVSYIFLIIFFSQATIISLALPILFVKKVQAVLDQHPSDTYPKLYPVGEKTIHQGLKRFLTINHFIFGIGLMIIAHALFAQPNDLLGWDNKGVISAYFFIQLIPIIFAEYSGFKFFKKMREKNRVSKRIASLKPKSWTQYFTKPILVAMVITQAIFIGLVVYFKANPFSGFGGYSNLIGLVFIDAVFLFAARWAIYGKKVDPLQPDNVKVNQVQTIINILVFSNIFGVLFVTLNLLMAASEFRPFIDITICLYNIALLLVGYRWFTKIDIDFEVYKHSEAKLS